MHLITIRDQVCNVMAGLTKTFVSPDIVLQKLEAITACSSWTKACTVTTWSSHRALDTVCVLPHRIPGCPLVIQAALPSFGDVPSKWTVRSFTECNDVVPFQNLPSNEQRLSAHTQPASGSPSPRPKAPILLAHLFFTHLWWPWWSPWCSSPGNS